MKAKPFVLNMDPDVSQDTQYKQQVRAKSQKLENTASDQNKDNTPPTAPAALSHTRQVLNVKRKITRQRRLKYKLEQEVLIQDLSDLFCIFPLSFYLSLFHNHLPHSFNLASAHTRTPLTPLLSIIFLPIKGSGSCGERLSIKGRVCRGGGFKCALNSRHKDACTQGDIFTKLQTHSNLKHRSRAQAAEVILITCVHVVECDSTIYLYAVPVPMRATTAKVSHALVSTL